MKYFSISECRIPLHNYFMNDDTALTDMNFDKLKSDISYMGTKALSILLDKSIFQRA